ncbi:hypothetical protein ACMU_12695 [Actibacterium mucosum KCTC 23349]|uniref:Uncharacterized protein n=1 Tax=Actibacterium mucosum KCTC 23349 TaxID=1454373 RepID=A0A037ZGG5_9RHOB|nr:hypothetical protein [Actibacterium mucosum]KAJ55545.1 hypothetical protein ACMU_12695 [Actibacterium mucosum KCTC 23349]
MLVTTTNTTAAQDLPPGWHLLREVQVTEYQDTNGDWLVAKEFPEALRERADDFQITGFYSPFMAEAYVQQFMLLPEDSDCPFCGASGYGVMLEVHMRHPLPDIAEGTLLTLTGRLELMDDPGTYQTARLLDARTLSILRGQ